MLPSKETVDTVYRKVSLFVRNPISDELNFIVEESISRLLEYQYVAKNRLSEPQKVAFLYKTATRLIIDESRRKSRLIRISQYHELIASDSDIFSTLNEKDMLLALQNALSSLSEIHHRTLEYKYFLELSIEEIAEIEGVTVAGVKKRLKTAKQLLYKRIKNMPK